jgi:multidrug efflux pump subunit AcrB/outer membrane protein TolC
MSLIERAIKNRQIVYLLTSIAVILGLHALFKMPRREDPKITVRLALVMANYPGATAEQVEAQVTRKIEPLLFRYAEVRKAKTFTTSRPGMMLANVVLEEWVDDPDKFWAMLRHDLNELKQTGLPHGIQGPIVNSNFGDVVAVLLTVSGERYGSRELTDYMDRIDDALRTIPEVSKIRRYGEQPEELAVTMMPARLAQLGVTAAQISKALNERNAVQEAGTVDAGVSDARIRTNGLFDSERELLDLVVGTSQTGQVIHLGDVAAVTRRYADADFLVRVDGQPATLMSVEMQDGKNIVEFGHAIHAKVAEARKLLPSDLSVDLIADQPDVVDHRVMDFGHEFLIAVIAVILVTVLLLPFRVAAMAAIAIPVTVAVTIAAINAIGVELHQISFAGLVVALGMVVDDAIVVADNYIEKLDHGMSPYEAAWRGTTELAAPVLGATLTIVASFLPLAILLPGTTGEFIRALPISVSVALICSYIVAMFLTPLLAMAMIKTGLRAKVSTSKRRTPLDLMQSAYEWIMALAMPRKTATLAIAAGAFVMGLLMFKAIPTRFFPSAERDQFVVDIWTPEGTRIETTDSIVQRLADKVRSTHDVRTVSSFVGGGAPRFYYNVSAEPPAANYGQLVVNTASIEATVELVRELRGPLSALAPEARVLVKELQQGGTYPSPVEVRISGEDLTTLATLGDSVARMFEATPGSQYVNTDWHEDSYGIAVRLRHEVASRLGITEATLGNQLATGFDGSPASTFWEGSRSVGVRLRYDEAARTNPADIGDAYITSPATRARVPVREVADLSPEWQPSRIVRWNGVRTITVGSYAQDGVLASTILEAMKPKLAALDLPAGYSIMFGGEAEGQAETEGPMGIALGVSLISIFLILFFQFRTVKHPLIVMVSIPLGLFGSALGLILTRNPLGFTANLGVTALAGVVVRNAIILVDYILEQRKHGVPLEEAAFEAGRRRLRPIFLTTMAAAAGVVPMIASGSSLWAPLASVLAVGLVCSMVFTLVVVPVLFVLVERRSDQRKATREAAAAAKQLPSAVVQVATALAMVVGGALVTAPSLGAQGTPRTITLEDAVAMAKANSRSTRIARTKVKEKAAAARASKADLFPTLTAEGSYMGNSAHSSIDIPAGALGVDGTGTPFPSQGRRIEQDGSSATFAFITLNQPITPLFKIAQGTAAAVAALKQSEAEALQTELDVALGVEKLYVAALRADRQREAAVAMLSARQASLGDVQKAAGTGMVVDARVSEAKANALDAERALLSTDIAAEDARADLNELLGLPRETELQLVAPAVEAALGNVDDYVAIAGNRRPEVMSAMAQVEQARRGARAARADFVPDVMVFAKHTYQDAMAFIPANSFSAGVQAKWTIWDFGKRSNVVQQRMASEQLARENLARIRSQVEIDVEKAYRNAVRAELSVRVARQALDARRDVERISGGQAAAGLVLASSYREATANRLAAESALFEAQLGARIARAELARAAGDASRGMPAMSATDAGQGGTR